MFLQFLQHTMGMVILYLLLIAYILSINFYAFMLVKALREQENNAQLQQQNAPVSSQNQTQGPQKNLGKLLITGALGGAITIYACIFIFKWRRTDLVLMVSMPLLAVLNVYLWVLLFRSGMRLFVFA